MTGGKPVTELDPAGRPGIALAGQVKCSFSSHQGVGHIREEHTQEATEQLPLLLGALVFEVVMSQT
jgi:hypothetical protein